MTVLYARLSPELIAKLDAFAKQNGWSRTRAVERMIMAIEEKK